jgi:hypothetical protein
MPFKDVIKKKAYYESHQKAYNKQWVNDNRDAWNKYQAEQRRLKRQIPVLKAKKTATELNISDEHSLTYKAAVVFFYISEVGHFNRIAIAAMCGFKFSEVDKIIKNWKQNEFYDNGQFIFSDNDEVENIVGFTLFCMCGAGELIRTEIN